MRETNEEGMSTATWAGIAVAVMVVGGIAMYAFSATKAPPPHPPPVSSAARRR